jgi:hypothetical protein
MVLIASLEFDERAVGRELSSPITMDEPIMFRFNGGETIVVKRYCVSNAQLIEQGSKFFLVSHRALLDVVAISGAQVGVLHAVVWIVARPKRHFVGAHEL